MSAFDKGFLFDFTKKIGGSVNIWDETLRDGAQTPGVVLHPEEKLGIAEALVDIGVKYIAVGFPAVSLGEMEATRLICSQGFARDVNLFVPARALDKDIDAAAESGARMVAVFLATSYLRVACDYMKKDFGTILLEGINDELKGEIKSYVTSKISSSMVYAKERGLVPVFVAEDASRSDLDFLIDLFGIAIDSGAKNIIFTDTVGCLVPKSASYLVSRIRGGLAGKLSGVGFGVHCHNDLGLATANTLAAVEAGANFPHVCVNGFGERAGNTALEELVKILDKMGVSTGICLEELKPLSKLVEEKFGITSPYHKPIVGKNAFRHESGIHTKGISINPIFYEGFSPESVGAKREIIFGKGTGIHALRRKVEELSPRLGGIELDDRALRIVLSTIKNYCEVKSKDDIRFLQQTSEKLMDMYLSGVKDDEMVSIVKKVHEMYGRRRN